MRNKNECGLVVSPYCSNNCVFCRPLSESQRLSAKELSRLEGYIDKSIAYFRERGYASIYISGGDPLEYKKINRLVRRLKRNGFSRVGILTNGVALSDAQFCRELIKSGMDVFRVPLYGSDAKIHDSVTRAKGSFESTVKGIKNIRKISWQVEIVLTCLLLKQNMRDLPKIFDMMHSLECSRAYFSSPFITNDEFRSFYIPLHSQGVFYRALIRHALLKKKPVYFWEVPFCVIGFDNDFTSNSRIPVHLGKYYQTPKQVKTNIPDVPSYRRKIKLKMCRDCAVSFKCNGFYINDILIYGTGNLQPIKNFRDNV